MKKKKKIKSTVGEEKKNKKVELKLKKRKERGHREKSPGVKDREPKKARRKSCHKEVIPNPYKKKTKTKKSRR